MGICDLASMNFSFDALAEANIRFSIEPSRDKEDTINLISSQIKTSLGEDKYYGILGTSEYKNLFLVISDIVKFDHRGDESSDSKLTYLINVKREYERRLHSLWSQDLSLTPPDYLFVDIKNTHLLLHIDQEDYSRLSKFPMYLSGKMINYSTKAIHREIAEKMFGDLSGLEVDHKNGNRFDVRRSNLRKCSRQQNSCNKGLMARSTTRFKGVTKPKSDKLVYIAQIRVFGKTIYIGTFPDKRDAAIAYDICARDFHGEFAKTNIRDATSEEIARIKKSIDSLNFKRTNRTSRYRNVYRLKKDSFTAKPWIATYSLNRKTKSIGSFKTEEEAARAADNKAIELGRLDKLNFSLTTL